MVEINGQNLNSTLSNTKGKVLENLNDLAPAKASEDLVVENQLSNIDHEASALNTIHTDTTLNQKAHENNKPRNTMQEAFDNAPQWFQHFRNHLVTVLNAVGITLNATSVVASNSNIMPQPVAEYLDKAAEWYSRYVVSLGFGWNGVESIVGKRPIEALSRFLPVAGFMLLPFYNFNTATGISSFMSYVFDKVVSRNGGEQPGIGSAIENTKGTIKHTIDIFKEFFNNNSNESLVEKIGIAGLGLGTLGGLTFAAKERDSFAARFFGNMRNIGGLVADYELVFNQDPDRKRSRHKRTVGVTCSTASILNIIARWVDPKLGRILNHLSIAADDFGLTYWAQMSKADNDRAANKNRQKSIKEGLKAIDQNDHLVELSKPSKDLNQTLEQNYAQAA
jgi:hypothetical protein